jgi:hypothetical protein
MTFHLNPFDSVRDELQSEPPPPLKPINMFILCTVRTMLETVLFYLMLFSGHVIAWRIICHLLITETIVNFQSSLCGISARQKALHLGPFRVLCIFIVSHYAMNAPKVKRSVWQGSCESHIRIVDCWVGVSVSADHSTLVSALVLFFQPWC